MGTSSQSGPECSAPFPQVSQPAVVRSSVCDKEGGDIGAAPVYRAVRAALQPPAILQALHFVKDGAEAIAKGTMTVSATVAVTENAYIKLTMDPQVGPAITCDMGAPSVRELSICLATKPTT